MQDIDAETRKRVFAKAMKIANREHSASPYREQQLPPHSKAVADFPKHPQVIEDFPQQDLIQVGNQKSSSSSRPPVDAANYAAHQLVNAERSGEKLSHEEEKQRKRPEVVIHKPPLHVDKP